MSSWKWILWMLAIVAAAVAGALLGYINEQLQPVEKGDAEITVTIPSGATSKEIGALLEQRELIKNGQFFSYYVRYKQAGPQLKAGTYRLQKGMELDAIIEKLIAGETYQPTFTVTIPEGYTVEQIADLLERQGRADRDVFLREVQQGAFDFSFVDDIPESQTVRYRLEGYLFPETYEFAEGADEHAIIQRMLQQFDKEWNAEWREKLKSLNLTLHEAVTLASLVERETVVEKERPIVAGVLYNRLAIDMPLQIDATVRYALREYERLLTTEDLKVSDPYNTYENKGLPPGPIANPGRQAMESVLDPENHEYLYYVTKKDGTREHYFSKTFAEHKHYKALSKQNAQKQ